MIAMFWAVVALVVWVDWPAFHGDPEPGYLLSLALLALAIRYRPGRKRS